MMALFQMEEKNGYNLRSKSNTAKHNAPASPKKSATHVKQKMIRHQRKNKQTLQK
jgi:hypothetical protein